ncbi:MULTISPECIES: lytic transglycosylase domain-containing protein [unclassified Nocardioides]|uniref:aggregation-promoting factor C-terminal-like domain-containing protein n=1 Tax=unclassified Nocardioides TaxID=2615069 RepID=UPI0030148A5A
MSKHVKHVPTHRGAPKRPVSADAPKKAIRTTLVMSSVAVAATGATISGGLLGSAPDTVSAAAADLGATRDDQAADTGATEATEAAEAPARTPVVSRSDRREASDPVKVAALSQAEGGAMTVTESLSDNDPRDIARALLGEYGFSSDQFGCLDSLWTKESGWNIHADNPSSSAYGIPQALTATHDLGADYMTNPVTQIEWGLGYIRDRYGSPCSAWGHSQSTGWY